MFMKEMLAEMHLWTRKFPLHFRSHPDQDCGSMHFGSGLWIRTGICLGLSTFNFTWTSIAMYQCIVHTLKYSSYRHLIVCYTFTLSNRSTGFRSVMFLSAVPNIAACTHELASQWHMLVTGVSILSLWFVASLMCNVQHL